MLETVVDNRRIPIHTMWSLLARLSFVALIAGWAAPAPAKAAETLAPERIEGTVTWRGQVRVDLPVAVPPGGTLVIEPGTIVRFSEAAGLTVNGTLLAVGSEEAPILFTALGTAPEPGAWPGLQLSPAQPGTRLVHCRLEYAAVLSVSGGEPVIESCKLAKGRKGIATAMGSRPVIRDNRIEDMTEAGIECQLGSAPTVTVNHILRCAAVGIGVAQRATPSIRDNRIEQCGLGLGISGEIPPVEGNTLTANETGIVATQAGQRLVLRNNRIDRNGVGIECRGFSSPLIESNRITANETGIYCFRAASPLIRNNHLEGNQIGLSCVQLCRPVVTENEFFRNKTAIQLHLSSYAVIHRNNLHENEMHVRLDNMSSDWERKRGKKPIRARQAQNLTRARRGKAVYQHLEDTATTDTYVDATDNWWGPDVTAEMDEKGPEGNIGALHDYWDVPLRTYEGDPVEYVQDRINFSGWRHQKIAEAGL